MGIMDRRPARRPAPATPVAAPVTPAQPAPSPAPKPTAEPAQKPAAAPAPSGAAAPHKVMRGESSSGAPGKGVPVTIVMGGPLPGAEPVTVVTAGAQPEKVAAVTPDPDPRRKDALRDLELSEAALARGQFFKNSVGELSRLRDAMRWVITTTGVFTPEELNRAEKAREALEERIALRELVQVLATRTRISESELFARYAAKRLNFPAVLAGVMANLPSAAEDCEGLVRELGDIDLSMCEDDVQDAVKELVKTLRAKPSTPPPLPTPSASTSAPAKPAGSVTQVFATMDTRAAATTAPKPAPSPAPKPAAVAATRHVTPVVTSPSASDLVRIHKELAESTAAELRTAANGDAKLDFAHRNPNAINQLFTAREAAVNAGGTIADGVQMMYEIVVQSLLRLNYCCRVLKSADDLLKRAHALGEKGIHEVEVDLRKTEMLLEGLLSSKDDKERLPTDAPLALTKTKDLLAETRRNLDFIEDSRHGRTVRTVTPSDSPDASDRPTPVPPVVARPVVTPAPWADRARVEKDADAILGRSLGAIALPLFHNADEKEYARVREKSRDLADDARKAEGLGLPYVADKCRDASRILLDAENLARLMQGTSEHVRDRKASDWREAVKNRCDRIETAIARDRTLEAGSIARLVSEWRAMATQPEPVVAPQPAPVFEPSDADKKRRTRLAIAAAAAILAVVTAFVVGVVVSLSEETPIITPPPPTAEAPAPAPSAEPPPVAAPAPAPAPTPAPPPAPPQPRCRPYTSADVGGAPLTAVPQDMLSLNQLTMPCAHASANGQTYDLSACQVCTP